MDKIKTHDVAKNSLEFRFWLVVLNPVLISNPVQTTPVINVQAKAANVMKLFLKNVCCDRRWIKQLNRPFSP